MKLSQFTIRQALTCLVVAGCLLGWWFREASFAGFLATMICAVLLYWLALTTVIWPDG